MPDTMQPQSAAVLRAARRRGIRLLDPYWREEAELFQQRLDALQQPESCATAPLLLVPIWPCCEGLASRAVTIAAALAQGAWNGQTVLPFAADCMGAASDGTSDRRPRRNRTAACDLAGVDESGLTVPITPCTLASALDESELSALADAVHALALPASARSTAMTTAAATILPPGARRVQAAGGENAARCTLSVLSTEHLANAAALVAPSTLARSPGALRARSRTAGRRCGGGAGSSGGEDGHDCDDSGNSCDDIGGNDGSGNDDGGGGGDESACPSLSAPSCLADKATAADAVAAARNLLWSSVLLNHVLTPHPNVWATALRPSLRILRSTPRQAQQQGRRRGPRPPPPPPLSPPPPPRRPTSARVPADEAADEPADEPAEVPAGGWSRAPPGAVSRSRGDSRLLVALHIRHGDKSHEPWRAPSLSLRSYLRHAERALRQLWRHHRAAEHSAHSAAPKRTRHSASSLNGHPLGLDADSMAGTPDSIVRDGDFLLVRSDNASLMNALYSATPTELARMLPAGLHGLRLSPWQPRESGVTLPRLRRDLSVHASAPSIIHFSRGACPSSARPSAAPACVGLVRVHECACAWMRI